MSLNLERVLADVRRSADWFSAVDPYTVAESELIAESYAALSLLFENAAVAPVAKSVLETLSNSHRDVASIVWLAAADVRESADQLSRELRARSKEVLARDERDHLPLQHLSIVVADNISALQFVERLAKGEIDFHVASHGLNSATKAILSFSNLGFGASASAIPELLREMNSAIAAAKSRVDNGNRYVEALSLSESVTELRSSFDSIRCLVREGRLSDVDLPIPGRLRVHVQSVCRLLRQVHLELSFRGAEFHALLRAKSYFEHFAEDRLKSALNGRGRTEARIQKALDRFLFEQGVFPITHCAAAKGSLDTFVSERATPMLDLARAEQIPPVLIELKQLLRPRKTTAAKQMETLVKEAKQQAQAYLDHMRVNASWRGAQATVVVFYGGPKKFSADSSDVVLVYVGDATPSSKSIQLSLK